jgi:Holliday junction DNA helicase RuvA
MIASLTGILKSKNPTEVLIEVHDVGYVVSISLSTYEKLGNTGSTVTLLIHFHMREDTVQLFGFIDEEERRLFRLLISVSGIGPKTAQSVLSGISTEELKSHLVSGNTNALTSVPGIGRKTAERLVVELRDKVGKGAAWTESGPPLTAVNEAVRMEALRALVSLGYNQQNAEKAIRLALKEAESSAISIEELIKKALRHTSAK